MASVVIMPRQGQSVEACILGQWHKKVGDTVKTGDLLFSYETDKAAFDEEAKSDGILLARFFEEGDEVPVLSNVAVIGQEGESFEEFFTAESTPVEPERPAYEEKRDLAQHERQPAPEQRLRISPLARKMAAGMDMDFSRLKGSGPQGRIIARDIEAAVHARGAGTFKAEETVAAEFSAESGHTPPENFTGGEDFVVKPLSNMRRLIARAMHSSLQNSAQLTHHLGADARQLLAMRKKFKQLLESGAISENVTVNDLVCYAVVRALKKFTQVNAHFLGDKVKVFSKVHLGLAVDTERGLMVPVMRDADDLSVTGLSNRLRNLASGCRKGSISPDLLHPEAASFTVSNLGSYGVEMFTPVINLPQVAILGVCAITHRPVDMGDGVFAFVPYIGLSLTYDHRALDGGEATRFLAEVAMEIRQLQVV